jgi:MinD superfamily P-loop ATPase
VMPNVKNIIAVASGKGGVGKSTTAANLALALAAEGARVGMLDADIHGPSQTMMLNVSGKPETQDGKLREPKENYGLQIISVGLLVDQDTPMVLRGPIISGYLTELLEKTNWKDLDFLIIDMPPGTGDIQLTLSQKVPVTGAVIVTTPQDIALLDARRGVKMFEKVGIPILGVVENMAVHTCRSASRPTPASPPWSPTPKAPRRRSTRPSPARSPSRWRRRPRTPASCSRPSWSAATPECKHVVSRRNALCLTGPQRGGARPDPSHGPRQSRRH